jgi:multidrug efflux system outer membrane protein
MIRRASPLFVAVVVGLSGCAIGPDFKKPEPTVPAEYRGVLTTQQADSYADLGWAAALGDPELVPILRQAIDNNLDLQIALARVEEFRGYARVSRSYLGPELRGIAGTSPNGFSDEDSSYSLGLSLNWEIDLFGRLRRADEASRAQLLASEDAARGVMSTLIANVASTWFRLREIDQQIVIIEQTIASQEASLALVQSLKRNGVASGTEEQQAISQLAATRAQLPTAIQRRVQPENALRFLIGDLPASVPRSQPPGLFPVPDELPVGLPAQLLTRRPDIRQLENQLHAATANVGVAEASRFPYLSIGLTSFFGIVSPELSKLFSGNDPADTLFSVGPFADMPIFTSGRGTGNIEVAEAQLKQSELAYRRGVLLAYREVADALVVTDQVREFIGQTDVRVASARTVLKQQRMRYRAGVVSYLEVLDAERQLFQAELELARARLDQVLGYVELYRALGGGWSDAEIAKLAVK